jgi:hypothetical protein
MEQVSLLPPDRLSIDDTTSRALHAALAPLCAEDGVELRWLSTERWLAVGERLAGLRCASLDRVVGRSLDVWQPRTEPAHQAQLAWLQRLQSEAQMLFYTHAANDAREAQRLPSLNGVWFSGVGALPALPSASAPRVDDTLRQAALHGGRSEWQAAWAALDAGPLAELFPVEIDAEAGEGRGVVEAPDFQPLAMTVTARGAMHPAFAISGDGAANREAWGALPPFFQAAAVSRPKPSATVLAAVADPRGRGTIPLVAEAPFGRGRTAWIGTEETFRWRRNVGDPVFWRFWGQALRSIARRDDRPWDTSWLVVEPGRCEPGSSVLVELNLVGGDKRPVEAAVQQVSLAADGETSSLELAAAERPGLYRGAYTPEQAGRHVLTATSAAGPLSADLAVQASSRELARTAVDRGALRVLADLTGGAVLEPDAFSTLPYRLAETAVETSRTLEDDVWDTWPVLVLLVGLYCIDIGVRRLSGSA